MLQSLWDDFKGVEVNPPPKKVGVTVTEAALEKIESMCERITWRLCDPMCMVEGVRVWHIL